MIPSKKITHIKTFGNSMLPILQDGDVIYLKKISFAKIRINYIICISKKSNFFTHRIIYKTEKFLITRGDNNLESDGRIYPKNIVGLVNKISRRGQIFDINTLYLLQSTNYFKEIVKVKMALERVKIEPIFLKGLPLHLYFEKKHPQRYYSDCDLLIDPKKMNTFEKVLKKLGYREVDSSFSKIGKRLKKSSPETSFIRIVNGLPVVFDVHTEIVFMMTQLGDLNALYPRKLLSSLTQKMSSETQTINVFSENFKILSNSNLIIYLALHLYHHNFKGCYRYDFLKVIMKSQKVNYTEISETISEFKLQNFIYPVFLLLEKYYDFKFPKKFLDLIKPGKNKIELISKIVSKTNIFDEDARVESGVERFKNLFYLSPNRLLKKSLVFLYFQVLYSAFWIVRKKRFLKLVTNSSVK